MDIQFVPADDQGDDGKGLQGQIYITITGPWVEAIMWEVPLMACLSETYFQTVDKDWDYEGQAGELRFPLRVAFRGARSKRPKTS